MRNSWKIAVLVGICCLTFTAAASAKTLTLGFQSEQTSLDPVFQNNASNNNVAAQMFGYLVEMDSFLRPTPGLAISWSLLDDTTWEFKMRPGVKFHDGTPFTAHDVVYTIERIRTIKGSPSSFKSKLTTIKSATAVDDMTLHVKTVTPAPLLPRALATINIVSEKACKNATPSDFNSGKATIGTGPYKFGEYRPGEYLLLKAYTDYYKGKPYWDEIKIKFIPNSSARVLALLAGEVDIIEKVLPSAVPEILKKDDMKIASHTSSRVMYIHMDSNRDNSPQVFDNKGNAMSSNPLKDKRVRLALSKAINRDTIVERIMAGAAEPAGQILPHGATATSPNLKPLEYDPDGAKELLKEAGYPDGFKLILNGTNGHYPNDVKVVQAVAQMWTKIGVKTEVETMLKNIYFPKANKLEFSAYFAGFASGSGLAANSMVALLHTYDKSLGYGSNNRGRYSNPRLDNLVDTALKTMDEKKRNELIVEATEEAINDVALIPVYFVKNLYAMRKGVSYTPGMKVEFNSFQCKGE